MKVPLEVAVSQHRDPKTRLVSFWCFFPPKVKRVSSCILKRTHPKVMFCLINPGAKFARMVEEGSDVLPIDASFRIIRKQQEPARGTGTAQKEFGSR